MSQRINREILKELSSHTRKLGLKKIIKGMGYERHGELPFIVSKLKPLFSKQLRYLDIGSGDSIFPTYLLKNTNWDITCIDKFSTVNQQKKYASRILKKSNYFDRFHIVEENFNNSNLPAESFDIITNISVIEHFEGNTDSLAMKKSSGLLKKGGIYILSTLINDGYFKEFYLAKDIYSANPTTGPVFYQRHYDLPAFEKRVVRSSALKEIERLYQGEYVFQFRKYFLDISTPFKPIKILYQWASPFFARMFLTYRDFPQSLPDMPMITASCVLLVLTKE